MNYVTITAFARDFGVTRETVYTWVEKGAIKKRRDGKIDWKAAAVSLYHYQAAKIAGRPGLDSLADARTDLAKEQLATAELRNARERGEYVSTAAVLRVVSRHFQVIRDRLLGLPGQISDSLVGLSREEIYWRLYNMICEILIELSEPEEHVDEMHDKPHDEADDGRASV